jgi:hypothetical protein
MSLKERMDSLKAKHAYLDQQLHMEEQRPLPSSELLSRLKREKLKIKDELTRLGYGSDATVH